MTNETAWAHLPNAKHIATIMEDARLHRPAVWTAAADAGRAIVQSDLRIGARVAAHRAVESVPRVKAREAALWEAMWESGQDAILSLIAWDDSARMLGMSPAALRTLIDIAEGDVKHQAVLLLPAVLALSTKP